MCAKSPPSLRATEVKAYTNSPNIQMTAPVPNRYAAGRETYLLTKTAAANLQQEKIILAKGSARFVAENLQELPDTLYDVPPPNRFVATVTSGSLSTRILLVIACPIS